jgi:hypothetical protein
MVGSIGVEVQLVLLWLLEDHHKKIGSEVLLALANSRD